MAKSNWTMNDTVKPEDLNAIGQEVNSLAADGSVTDAKIGDRTISDLTAPTGDKGKLTPLLGWMAHMIKSITGKPNWRTAPRTTLENAVKRDGDTMTSHLTIHAGGATVISKPITDSDTSVMGSRTSDASGTWTWGTGSQPSSGKWGVYDYPNSRWALEILRGTALDDLKYRGNTIHHAGNHNSTGDPHSQYARKVSPSFSDTVTLNVDSHATLISGHTVAKPSETTDYMRSVILLHPVYEGTPLTLNYCVGEFFAHRGSSINNSRTLFIKVNTQSAYTSNRASAEAQSNSSTERVSFVTCKYGGVKYLALELPYAASKLANGIYFEGYIRSSGTEKLKYVEYFNAGTNSAVNAEIHSSLVPFTANNVHHVEAHSLRVNGELVHHDGNHNSEGNPHSQYALLSSTPQARYAAGSLNSITTPGFYRLQQTHADAPSSVYSYGNMIVARAGGADTITQIIFPYQGGEVGKIVFRSGSPTDVGGASTWSPWKQIWNEVNMGAGSGLDADKLDGMQTSSSTAAHTVATRDSSGNTGFNRVNLTAATGASPLIVASTTLNTNLNADMVDGYNAQIPYAVNTIPVRGTDGKTSFGIIETNFGTSTGGVLHHQIRNGTGLRFGTGLTAAETGSNGGSNFGIWRYDDAGASLGMAFSIQRSNGNAYFSNAASAAQLVSRAATGTAPLSVESTTVVPKLNADMVDGYHATALATPSTAVIRDANADIVGRVFKSSVAPGTAPFYTASTTKVANFNADMLDDCHASMGYTPNTIATRNASGQLAAYSFHAYNPNNVSAINILDWLNDQARIRIAGSGTGATNGFEVHTTGDRKIFRANDNGQWQNFTPQGTSPLIVASTTRVGNLNADMVDDCHATSSPTASTVAIRGPQGTLKAAAPQAPDDLTTKGWVESHIIQPTKPRTADLMQNSATAMTYYTLVDITGKGKLSRVTLASTTLNYNLGIRITVDGTSSLLTPGNYNAGIQSRGFQHYSGTGSYTSGFSLDYFTDLVFFNSLKIEVMHTHASNQNLHASADYALV